MSNEKAHILLVDDDAMVRESLSELLRLEGYEVRACAGYVEAAQAVRDAAPDLVVSDVNLPERDGLDLLAWIKERYPQIVVVMMTAFGTIESAVEAIKLGAYDYLTKPILDDDIYLTLERALAQQKLVQENLQLRRELDERYGLDALIGHDYRMLKIFDMMESVADSDVTVLIQGPSGTGKSMTARVLHRLSARSDKPLIEVAVGAIPDALIESELFGHVKGAFTGAVANKEGKFKAADGGTIFLDEIGTASPSLQIKLLRALQDRRFEPVGSNQTLQVDVRVILATNLDLEKEVAAGRFREDLWYRINVISLDLPALKDRVGDIPLLAQQFLKRTALRHGRTLDAFDPAAIRIMQRYEWPGNVRELANVVERCVILSRGPILTPDDLPPKLRQAAEASPSPTDPVESSGADGFADFENSSSLREALEEPEKRILEAALQANNWNRQRTAQKLNINRTTLYKKMKRFGLDQVTRARP